jgi:hypothetical protein
MCRGLAFDIEQHNRRVRQALRVRLLAMDWQEGLAGVWRSWSLACWSSWASRRSKPPPAAATGGSVSAESRRHPAGATSSHAGGRAGPRPVERASSPLAGKMPAPPVDGKRVCGLNVGQSTAQQRDGRLRRRNRAPIGRNHREKVAGTGGAAFAPTAIVGHGRNVPHGRWVSLRSTHPTH